MNETEKEKDKHKLDLANFLTLVSGIDNHMVPSDDAKDMQNGASHIPYEVTDIRRAGEKVKYLGNNKWEYKDRIIT